MPKKTYIPTRLLERSSQLRRLKNQKINISITQHSGILPQNHSQSPLIEHIELETNKTTSPDSPVQLQIEPNDIIDHNKNLVQCLPPISVLNTYTFKKKN